MDEGSWDKRNSFVLCVSCACISENTSSFSVKSDAVDTQWLIDTSAQARKLIDQRSNVDLQCLFTCLNRAKGLQSAGKDGPSSGNQEWIDNISQWAAKNKTSAALSVAVSGYFQKYGFALYQNVASDRYAFPLLSLCVLPIYVINITHPPK